MEADPDADAESAAGRIDAMYTANDDFHNSHTKFIGIKPTDDPGNERTKKMAAACAASYMPDTAE